MATASSRSAPPLSGSGTRARRSWPATGAAGALVISDSVQLDVQPLADLVVTLYLPGEISPGFQITGRYARQTNYISPPGNFAAAITMPIGKMTDEWFFVSGIDVLASKKTGCVVALGDSLTDANISTHDAYCRWPDQLARRLIARQDGRPLGVMNQGLGGNRILHDLRGDSGLRGFDRGGLAQPGVPHAIVMLGTNDLRNRNAKPDEEVTAEQMIAGLNQMALRAQARGIKLFGATLTPFGNETFLPGAWNPVPRGASRRGQHLDPRKRRLGRRRRFRQGVARPRASDPDAADLRLRRRASPKRSRLLQDGRRNRPSAVRLSDSPQPKVRGGKQSCCAVASAPGPAGVRVW